MSIFNIRVYALIINNNRILLSDEFRMGMLMTKFPGGGLKYGEGTKECLKREAKEEFGQEIEIIDHFYTTDFYQKAMFFVDQQLISIYYLVKFIETPQFKISKKPFDFEKADGAQSFRWEKLKELSPEMLSFPIDKKVVELLKNTSKH